MSKTTKTELNNMIVRYAALNEQKKPLVNECKELSDDIKEAMENRGVTTFAAMGWNATITYKRTRKLDMAKLEALLTKEQIEACKVETIVPTLSVTAAAATIAPKVEKATKAA